MEGGDTSGDVEQGSVSLELHFNDVHPLNTNQTTQACLIAIPENNKLGELTLSCGNNPPIINQENPKQNPPLSTNGNGQLLDSAENVPYLALPVSSEFHFPMNPSLEAGNNHPSLPGNEVTNGQIVVIPSVVDHPKLIPILNLGTPSFSPSDPLEPYFQRSPSFNFLALAPYTPTSVEMVLSNGMVQPIPPEHDDNWMNPRQFNNNAQAHNSFQIEFSLPQRVTPSNQISGVDQYIAHGFPQAPNYRPSLLPPNQTWTGDAMPPWMNQHPSNWLSLSNNALCRPLTPLRPQQLPNQQQQHNQVPGIETSSQHFRHQFNQVAMPPNVCDPTMLPDPSLTLRPPQYGHYHQVPAAPDHELYYNSMSLVNTWNQQLSNDHYQKINQTAGTPTSVHPPQPALSLLPHADQLQGQLNQNARSASNPNLDTSQQTQLLNSETHNDQESRDMNTQIALSRNDKGKQVMGGHSDGKSIIEIEDGNSIFEIGDASSSSATNKRLRVESITQENQLPASRRRRPDWNLEDNTRDKQGMSSLSILSSSRSIGNSVYNPLFEEIGLPIDPHLRMLALN